MNWTWIDVEDVTALIIRLLRIIMAMVMMDGDGDGDVNIQGTITTIHHQPPNTCRTINLNMKAHVNSYIEGV